MFSHRSFAPLALAAFVVPACAHNQQPSESARSDSPDVHVVGAIQSCVVNRSADSWLPTAPDEVTVKLSFSINNASNRTATLFPGRLRLLDDEINKECAPRPSSATAVSIAAGENRQIAVEFHGAGDFNCGDRFVLKLAEGIEKGGSPVALEPLHFAAR